MLDYKLSYNSLPRFWTRHHAHEPQIAKLCAINQSLFQCLRVNNHTQAQPQRVLPGTLVVTNCIKSIVLELIALKFNRTSYREKKTESIIVIQNV
jgi:hypothetical protein